MFQSARILADDNDASYHEAGDGTGAHSIGAALALAEVVVDVDRLLHIWTAFSDLLHHIHHQIQHVPPILEGIFLAPLHILRIHCHLGAAAHHTNPFLAARHVCKWLACHW